ncbi:MAG: M20/M25/M40 family metallo-hydrolase [Gammaproteobacteria bacterium]|nr:M20/M25/M40 family metallo-hydrolase [Gammaproteobacteria bacterium]
MSAEERQIQQNLQRHVGMLAQTIGERNVWNTGSLTAAAMYIRNTLMSLGYEVRIQSFDSEGIVVHNLEVELPGTTTAEEIIVVGAHYDSVRGGPGANDNASGIAALLEIARLLDGKAATRTLRLVAFANEEQPFSGGPEMGSRMYAERSQQRGEQIRGMLSLETIGYYSDQPGSQHYPFPFSYFYPDTGNFIGFVGDLASWRLVRQSIGAFRTSTFFLY